MKPVLTFVLGAALAGGVAFFAMRKPAEPVAASPVAPVASVNEPPGTPAPPASAVTPPAEEPANRPAPVVQPKRSAMPRKPAVSEHMVAKVHPPASAPAANPTPTAQEQTPAVQTPPSPPPVAVTPPRIEERQPEPRVPRSVTLPAGSLITVRLDEALSSDRNQPGDSFRAILDQPLAIDGLVVAERKARVMGRIVEANQAGRVKGVSLLSLELTQMTTSDGQKVKLQTETFSKQGDTSKKADAAKIGAAAAIGAAIGAIAGGGKGAAIGAGAGGAAGTGGVMATRGKAAELPIETKLSFRLRDAVTLTEQLK
jgi:hypothetical protein